MAGPFGPELPPSSPEYQWVRTVIGSIERRTGSWTRWNGRVYEETDPTSRPETDPA